MLPIFRIISVGGVSLAISILGLALIPPGGTQLLLTPHETEARGAMLDPRQHPEWRQFMIHAALRRADELEQLRSLPDAPVRLPEVAAQADGKAPSTESSSAESRSADSPSIETPNGETPEAEQTVAGLQSDGRPANTNETTGSISDDSGATIPIDIGEASSTELPVGPVEERPPVSGLRDSRVPDVDLAPPQTLPAMDTVEKAAPAKPAHRAVQHRPRHKSSPPTPPTAAADVPPPFNIIAAFFASLNRAQPVETPAAPLLKKPAAKVARQPSYKQAFGNRAVAQ